MASTQPTQHDIDTTLRKHLHLIQGKELMESHRTFPRGMGRAQVIQQQWTASFQLVEYSFHVRYATAGHKQPVNANVLLQIIDAGQQGTVLLLGDLLTSAHFQHRVTAPPAKHDRA
uniref:Uncharacterized protein n=1 Tax=Anopheles quadriannulatus TaxID=34691 RepID=A0A182XTZ5_ANOQN